MLEMERAMRGDEEEDGDKDDEIVDVDGMDGGGVSSADGRGGGTRSCDV
jgi:hypothetical protein